MLPSSPAARLCRQLVTLLPVRLNMAGILRVILLLVVNEVLACLISRRLNVCIFLVQFLTNWPALH